ncbi:heterocyst-inhibiting protein PatX [Mastigocoleus testarum]|uniref:Uncharacterized protein n=1 Tax=Mastigocoleus testarum BC008 TaxID=371196 RepID=A0A0V7ZJE4_9CYAN|nr:hypothetical protein [Mastigocoleus testarum]KST64471.1 hypothetical protein BC008_17740 [Mastigocoleus testarum BC008]KST67800.1 hypothetical protein BC008_44460 [Mastigocoleus testarum BC008]
MRTATSIFVTIFMFGSLAFNAVSTSAQAIEQSFIPSDNQELIANRDSTRPSKGTPYRGSGRRKFM